MKHRVSGKKLNRDTQHRRALKKNLISSLVLHGAVKTTHAKAKVVQPAVDKLMSKAKKGTVHDRRQIDAVLNRTMLVNKLVDEIAPKTKRSSGFTRIVRLGERRGDRAMMVRLEWVDRVSSTAIDKKSKKKIDSTNKKAGKTSKNKSDDKATLVDKSNQTTSPAKAIKKETSTSSNPSVQKNLQKKATRV